MSLWLGAWLLATLLASSGCVSLRVSCRDQECCEPQVQGKPTPASEPRAANEAVGAEANAPEPAASGSEAVGEQPETLPPGEPQRDSESDWEPAGLVPIGEEPLEAGALPAVADGPPPRFHPVPVWDVFHPPADLTASGLQTIPTGCASPFFLPPRPTPRPLPGPLRGLNRNLGPRW